jgi:hypothetical protein
MTELNVYEEVVTRRPRLPKNLLIVDDEETTRELCASVAAQVGLGATSCPQPNSPSKFWNRVPWAFFWWTSNFRE